MEFQYEVDNNLLEEQDPNFEFVSDFIRQMNSETSSYCTFSLNDDCYIQCAGSKTRLTIEYREPIEGGFSHYVIGVKSLLKIDSKVPYSGGSIKVKKNEIFNAEQAVEIFDSFINNNKIPENYTKRDTTLMFLEP